MKTADYREMLSNLLPPGTAWQAPQSSRLSSLFMACACELGRLDEEVKRLIDEADPQTAVESLDDWERVLGLPDECVGSSRELAQRRANVIQRLQRPGGLEAACYISIARSFGYENASVETFHPFCVEDSGVEEDLFDARSGADAFNGWLFVFRLNLAASKRWDFAVEDSGMEEGLCEWGNNALECVIRREKPAHASVLFAYGAN